MTKLNFIQLEAIEEAIAAASDEMFEQLVKKLPEANYCDMAPDQIDALEEAMRKSCQRWIINNVQGDLFSPAPVQPKSDNHHGE